MTLKLNKETIKHLDTNSSEQVNGGLMLLSAVGKCNVPEITSALMMFSWLGTGACVLA